MHKCVIRFMQNNSKHLVLQILLLVGCDNDNGFGLQLCGPEKEICFNLNNYIVFKKLWLFGLGFFNHNFVSSNYA